MRRRALCPECGKSMVYDRDTRHWDCGSPEEGGHGFWDPDNNEFEYEEAS